MRQRHLPLTLPPDLYERLERQAAAAERTEIQQARWLLRQVLSQPDPAREPVADGSFARRDGSHPERVA